MNGATEATLQDLLAVAQAMNANLVGLNRMINRMGSAGGGTGSGSGSGTTASVGAAASAASAALGGLRIAGSLVSGAFSLLGTIVGKTIGGLTATVGNLYEFAKSAAMGTAKLSDFYNAFRDLPFFIGSVMSLAADIVRYQEGLLDYYNIMTRAGATFSGNLSDMRLMATRGFLSMDEFSKVVRANSEIFSTLGGNVDNGIRKFVDTQAKLMGPGSQYSKQLLGLGYTSESVAELLGAVYNQQGNLNKAELQNNDRVAAAVANTAKELDLFSRATGKNREELEKELKEKSFDAAWKTFTQGLTPEEAKRAEAAISKALEFGGKGAADGIKQMFMTGGTAAVPINDAMRDFAVQTNGAADDFYKVIYQSVMNAKLTDQERLAIQLKAGADIGRAYNQFIGPLGNVGGILSLQGNNLVNNAKLQNTALKMGQVFTKEANEMARTAGQNQQKAAVGTAAALAQANVNIKNFGVGIMELVNQLIGPIAGYLINFGNQISKELYPIFQKVITWFKKTFDELSVAFKTDGIRGAFSKAIEKLGEGFKNIWEVIGEPITRAMQNLWDKLRPPLQSHFEMVASQLWTAIKDFLFGGPAKDAEEAKARIQKKMDEINAIQDPARRQKAMEIYTGGSDYRMEQARIQRAEQILAEREQNSETKRLARERELETLIASRRTVEMNPQARRHSGTLGMTGNWWEKENTTVQIQAGETVATQSQIAQIVDAASQKGVAESILALNNTMRTLVAVTQKVEQNTKDTVQVTKRLGNDAFQLV